MPRAYFYFVSYGIWDRGRPAGEGRGVIDLPEAITSMEQVQRIEVSLQGTMPRGHQAVLRSFHPLRIEG